MIVSPWKETPRRLKKWRNRTLRYLRKAMLVWEPKLHKEVTIRNRKNYQKAKKLDRRIGA
jgi:hypothetical protein